MPHAIEAGAKAIVAGIGVVDGPSAVTLPGGAALIEAADPAAAGAAIAERFFGSPCRLLSLVGITGTNGKTTIAWLVRHLVNHAGGRCGLSGTILIDDGATESVASLTTPGAIEISRQLGRMVANGCDAGALEVSSHALAQGRCCALRFAAGVFTNLSGDHLDFHQTIDAYGRAKARLFESLDSASTAIVNADDPASQIMLAASRCEVLRCTLDGEGDCRGEVLDGNAHGSRVRYRGPWGEFEILLPLIGRHNVMNALQAAASAFILGVGPDDIASGLACCTAPPGRLERVTQPDDPFTVLVDYAHTDAALENVLAAVRPTVPVEGRLWVIFGCGGDRDRTKRPRMASVACRLADRIVITSDNPRTEPPESIVAEVEVGVPPERAAATDSIVDRREAIEHAIVEARPGDVVVIAGKGHEDYQIVGGTKTPFDDRRVARAALERHLRKAVTA